MTHELTRPSWFSVQKTKKPSLGVVNQKESMQLLRKQYEDLDGFEQESWGSQLLPAGALPVVRSPRQHEKTVFVSSPTKVPPYFRWKPKPITQSKPYAPKGGPAAPSPRMSKSQQVWQAAAWKPSTPAAMVPLPFVKDAFEMGPEQLDKGVLTSEEPVVSQDAAATFMDDRMVATPQKSSLFDYGDAKSPPSTASKESLNIGLAGTSGSFIASPAALTSSNSFRNIQTNAASGATTTAAADSSESSMKTAQSNFTRPTNKQQQSVGTAGTQAASTTTSSSAASTAAKLQRQWSQNKGFGDEENQQRQQEQDPETYESEEAETYNERDVVDPLDALASPLILNMRSHGPAQEKVIAQHVLRSKFMRKYLHVSNLTRKLKETEQILRSTALHAGLSIRIDPKAPLLNKASMSMSKLSKPSDDDEDSLLNESMPVLRRLSSIDKAINKTVKHIRRLSNSQNGAARKSVVAPAPHLKSKFAALRAISEEQKAPLVTKFEDSKYLMDDGDDDDDGDLSHGEAKIDNSSAQMMRICQHVIAKRAIKAFLRQERSVITQTEISLRDDPSMVHRARIVPAANSAASSNGTPSGPNGAAEQPGRVPIKVMSPEIMEAVSAYLKEGDQHMTIEELYAAALVAEKDKVWKRAILLASACIVIDREYILVILLRARCCRRIGLWTQAIQDISHALLLRADEHKLFLLRAYLYEKMNDLENALIDVNRALFLHPKSIDALLLRADIFHRKNAIGAALQDLTNVLGLDPSCWHAYYDRATIRIRAVEGDEQSLIYHWEHMKYEQLLASIIEDYVNALRKGCQLVEVVETIGDLAVRLLEFTGDTNIIRQVVHNFSHLLQILSVTHSESFHASSTTRNTAQRPSEVGLSSSSATSSPLDRELLVAAIHAQRGRMHVLVNDRANALIDFDHAVVMEYHYPVAHFYRGAFATLLTKDDDNNSHFSHLTKCITLDPTIAGAYTVRGALYLRNLKFNNALQDFKAAVATDPTLYEVWLQIALIYLNHYHDCDECIKACTNALTNDSCLSRALYLRGEAYTRQGNIPAALRDYGRLTMAQPDDRWAQLMRGRLLLQLKLSRPALYSFILFMEQGSASGDKRAHVLCGRAFKILRRFKHAVDEFQRAVTLNPTSENLVLLSESLHSMGDTENSLRVSEQVISADPGGFKGYVRRAQLLVSVCQFQLALSEYDKAVALAPKEGRVYYERGIVQMQLYLRWRVAFRLNFEKPSVKRKSRSPFDPQMSSIDVEATLGADAIGDEALVVRTMNSIYTACVSDFCRCIRLEPTMADPYVDRAELYALTEEYDKAFHDFESAIERNPKCVRALMNLGVLKCHFLGFASAIEDFDKAIKCDSSMSLAFFDRGVAYQKLSLWKQAEKSYDKCISLAGTGRNIDAHRNRAITRCQLNDFKGALDDFNEVKQCAPDDDQLHGGLGYVLLQLGRYEDAAKCFATYGRLSRDTFADSGNAYFNLGTKNQAHIDEHKHASFLKTALRFYLRAARIHPSNIDIRLNIANCLRKLNEPLRAISQCDAIAAAKPMNHGCLESKALAFFKMNRLQDAIESMNAAIRTCVATSSSLENIFYAFANRSIHRNALERKTLTSGGGDQNVATAVAEQPLVASFSKAESDKEDKANAEFLSAAEAEKLLRERLRSSEVVLNGSSKQMLSLYMMNRGIMFEKQDRFDDARMNYRDAIHFDIMSVNAYICMGTLDLLERKYADSIAQFSKALSIDNKAGIAYLNMGVAHLCLHDLKTALIQFDLAITLLPSCSYAYYNKAITLARLGDLQQAEHHFKRAIEELPSRKEYYLARGKIIAQQKRLQDAMVDFSTALYLGYEGKL